MISTESTVVDKHEVSRIEQRDLVRVLVAERVKMLAYIDSLVRDEDLSEDLFQEVCMLATEKAASIIDETHLVKWMRTSARYLAMNAIKKRRRNAMTFDTAILDQLDSQWQDQSKTSSADWTEALRHCTDLLPPKSKDLIRRRYVEAMDYPQLASRLGRPVASLYVTFSRILSTLNECINQQMGTGRRRIRE